MSQTEIQKLITGISKLEENMILLEIRTEHLTRELDGLRDIQRAAQYLVDVINVQGAGTTGGPYQVAYDNLREALKHYYAPNGPSTPQPH